MADSCVKCGRPLAPEDRFCPACGAKQVSRWAAQEPAPAPAAPGPGIIMPRPALLARFGKMIALLGFLLPWVTVSCAGQTLVSVDGLSLATGNVRMRNPMTGALDGGTGGPELLVLLAALAILLGLGLSFLKSRRQASVAAIACAGGAILLAVVELYVRIPAEFRASMARGSGRPPGGWDRSIEQVVSIGPGAGFWVTVLALAAAIALHVHILRRPPPG